MGDLNLEFVKDIFKILLIFIPLAYFLGKSRKVIIRERGLFFLIAGFLTMLVGGIVDFCGDVSALDDVFILGKNFRYHETAEDILGIIGFIMFTAGIATQIGYISRENLEKKKTIQKLNEQAEQLKGFDELKSKFIADISHEFRSPLSSVNMGLNNIIDGLMGNVTDQQKKALSVGKKNLERLSRLVSDLLTLSQIESGRIVMNRKLNDISSLAEEAYLSLRPLFESKNTAFDKVCRIEDARAWCDADKILRVFVNLLSNGLKYSPPNTRITATISAEGRDIRVEIEDQGRGISPEDMEKLFNRFERLNAKNEDGMGLGLVISREIVNLHSGKLWAESKPRQGAKFIFTIPKNLREGNRA